MLEPQILKTLYGERYSRIIVITQPMSKPGTNTAVRDCFDDPFVWIETDDEILTAMGFVDGGLAEFGPVHLLLTSPRKLIVDFWRKVVAGTPPVRLALPDAVRERGHAQLRAIGIDPLAPFAFFHVRTNQYQTGGESHVHRTTSVAPYLPSIRRLLGAGYQVVRIGEAGLDPEDWSADGYVSLPDALPGLAPQERAVDLAVLADAAFGTAQNSGPIWVAAAFGTPSLRTNTPYEHLNLPYNRDLTLFKRYRLQGSNTQLGYADILDRRIPAVLRDREFSERGIELIENTSEEIEAATDEFLSLQKGEQAGLQNGAAARFIELGRAYEESISKDSWFQQETLDFYGYAHPFGTISKAQLDGNPDFLR